MAVGGRPVELLPGSPDVCAPIGAVDRQLIGHREARRGVGCVARAPSRVRTRSRNLADRPPSSNRADCDRAIRCLLVILGRNTLRITPVAPSAAVSAQLSAAIRISTTRGDTPHRTLSAARRATTRAPTRSGPTAGPSPSLLDGTTGHGAFVRHRSGHAYAVHAWPKAEGVDKVPDSPGRRPTMRRKGPAGGRRGDGPHGAARAGSASSVVVGPCWAATVGADGLSGPHEDLLSAGARRGPRRSDPPGVHYSYVSYRLDRLHGHHVTTRGRCQGW
ncbi:hypothetical protein BH23CHL8_BH23CHL8_13530 [soil metagenome]